MPGEEDRSVWLPPGDAGPPRGGWHTIRLASQFDCVGVVFHCLPLLLDGDAVVFTGDLTPVAGAIGRLWEALRRCGLPEDVVFQCFCRCTVRLDAGEFEGLFTDRLPCRYWPTACEPFVDESRDHPTYIPAYVACSLYGDVFAVVDPGDLGGLRRRFVNTRTLLQAPNIGDTLCLNSEVFVPDGTVLDLLASVLFRESSRLADDICGATVLEPCTGSGVLGIALARAGAEQVICGDIHTGSVRCARRNVERAGLSGRVSVVKESGLPFGVRPNAVLVNPPWIGTVLAISEHAPSHFERCLEDIDHALLRLLLAQGYARLPAAAPFYVFLGGNDPFESDAAGASGPAWVDVRALGWAITDRWDGLRALRLYRLERS